MAGDPFWGVVRCAMHMDDAGLTDIMGHGFTLTGGAARSATQSKFGGYSVKFDGVNDEVVSSSSLPELAENLHGVQFFCYPETQLMALPCVLTFQEYRIEYKPSGYPNGFVINYNGTRTALGTHAENQWHFFWMTRDDTTVTICINGAPVTTLSSVPDLGSNYLMLGSAYLAVNTTTAFKGYIDDLLMTSGPAEPVDGHWTRWDYSIPTTAFPEYAQELTGTALGSLSFGGLIEGIVAPIGSVSGALRVTGLVEGNVPCAGQAVGSMQFSGYGVGVVGRTGVASGSLRFTGSASGFLGSFGAGLGSLRFTGYGVGVHGVAGAGSGALTLTGSATGTTPEHPVGYIQGSLRFTGYGYGLGGSVDTDSCH